ncbi:hypothetical protein AM571_PC01297 (plasmid) [Rhizobium etli 8C-3]|uniref:Uncharacterized protein n=1 Tax=Rhizobium etli 8C-3 TaxID=538025 RepID=A0A1L5PG67_RHIET|nr:hypothetical protein AM571_PC01297 [Rhizobium etli 8C-3]
MPLVLSDSKEQQQEPRSMMDIILLGIVVAFFALCSAYTSACDRL